MTPVVDLPLKRKTLVAERNARESERVLTSIRSAFIVSETE